jgi:hypothetical protein
MKRRRPLSWYTPGKLIRVCDSMQADYRYRLACNPGDIADHPDFTPLYTPQEMLALGVFEGQYLDPSSREFPAEWFAQARLSDRGPDDLLNAFGVKCRQSSTWWRERNLLHPDDPRGWFEWYCRFWLGRRHADDDRQVKRWRAFVRHSAQVAKNGGGDPNKRRKQRQALLQWSYNPYPDFPRKRQRHERRTWQHRNGKQGARSPHDRQQQHR